MCGSGRCRSSARERSRAAWVDVLLLALGVFVFRVGVMSALFVVIGGKLIGDAVSGLST
jgi:hypothetical protein